MFTRVLLLPALFLLLSGCASGPAFDTAQVDRALTPRGASAEFSAHQGKSVLWGGVILNTSNLADSTQIEVLAYPLDNDQRPQRDNDPLGRFIVRQSGFLEPARYQQGRLLTVVGTLTATLAGKVGDADYSYAVIDARQLHLWSKESAFNKSNVHFGIGVGIGL